MFYAVMGFLSGAGMTWSIPALVKQIRTERRRKIAEKFDVEWEIGGPDA